MTTLPEAVVVFTDGCSKGNPGPAGAGWVVENSEGEILGKKCEALGMTTNNEAEYRALIGAMVDVLAGGARHARFFTDSQLMAHQINGIYKIKNANLASLAAEVMQLRQQFETFSITHVLRGENKRADEMANRALEDLSPHRDCKLPR